MIRELSGSEFDLLVIGGGITGAGIALDAASRGLKVALVEMQDFAAGTSSRSTKLIHGGLRYLKQLEFGLVAEVGKERKLIYRLAPHLTRPEHMLLPVRKGDSLGILAARLGMFIYERLAWVLPSERNKSLNVDGARKQEPLLPGKELRGGILFYEYRTDDARLTLEVLKQASTLGAAALNYFKVTGFTYHNGKLNGAKTKDMLTGKESNIKAKYVVNASGPWVDELAGLDHKQDSKLTITKGIHLVVDHAKLPVKQSIYFEAADKRMLFIIPRSGKTYIGTTDTFYKGELSDPEITHQDRDYILSAVNNYFEIQLRPSEIESGWAGLRPLISKPGKKAGEISRKDEIFLSDSGLITIAGGKLTGYRKMAERVMNVISDKIKKDTGKKIPSCTTDQIYLSGGKPDQPFNIFLKEKRHDGEKLGLSRGESDQLTYRYGSNVETVLGFLKKINTGEVGASKNGLPAIVYAQLLYGVKHEMCVSSADFFIRRTGMFYFDIQETEKWHIAVAEELNEILKMNYPAIDDLQQAIKKIHLLRLA